MSDVLKTLFMVILWSTLVGWFAYKAGQDVAEVDFSLYKQAQLEQVKIVEEDNKNRIREANGRIALLTEELNQRKKIHEKAIIDSERSHASRLRNSEKRAELYRSQARGSEAEREYLSAHAAKLDRAIEEGRRLVVELRSTLEQREYELRVIGEWFKEQENVHSSK